MSTLSIKPYFPFCRVRITRQSVSNQGDLAWIVAEPDARFHPVCHVCGTLSSGIHSTHSPCASRLEHGCRNGSDQLQVPQGSLSSLCQGIRVEDLEFFHPYQRVTKRLAQYIHDLCKILTVAEVADHFDLDWKTVKNIDKAFLEKEFGTTDYDNLQILAVDEIAIQKGHRYMTVVLDYQTGRVVWLGKDRKAETLNVLFSGNEPKTKSRPLRPSPWICGIPISKRSERRCPM